MKLHLDRCIAAASDPRLVIQLALAAGFFGLKTRRSLALANYIDYTTAITTARYRRRHLLVNALQVNGELPQGWGLTLAARQSLLLPGGLIHGFYFICRE